MHNHTIEAWTHEHVFLGAKHDRHARRTWAVVALTAAMMIFEIVGGTIYGSMALVADGWHMSTHAAALGIAALAYHFARQHACDRRFSFGTGKLGDLAAFASAIILAMIALCIAIESADRLLHPVAIGFGQALPIAVVGLLVNLASVWLLHDSDHGHDDGHAHHQAHDHHEHGHSHGEHDTNFRAAYVHVLADALTSVLAIVALLGGRYYGLTWLDPVMGLVGTVVIAAWCLSLIKSAGAVLLDKVPSSGIEDEVRHRLEVEGDRVADLHLWQVGPGHQAVVISIVSDAPQAPSAYKARLAGIDGLSHVTVEVQPCLHHAAAA
ncbi:CDF family Co(II)/Ni(II) efflux transporter DmeF [Methylobacterium gnaphalii]|uniref:Cation efflux system protein n=1 Tax=Methylobacterium gnaphalii TaxID=1010610 RepID=A0A512JR79_9HYPH|nr:CDF family Co(II)/Ni(II) efflux transporter DmeF [Methylobacterium gnaphalii]GEP12478.1 cation efflux system protein [Methylobacterium gnaphalii]GJD71435.1 Cadmium, cobalt and zinc/H(+)-K(+) antiporter [Methylobacterium gnaphalii]GLS50598.1 cation efflux system protein [Methylobacterium gnaphalii]